MKKGTCPEGHSSEVYKTDFSPLSADNSLVRLYNPKGKNLAIEVYLCANCGHLEMRVPQSHQPRIPDLVRFDKWKKVE